MTHSISSFRLLTTSTLLLLSFAFVHTSEAYYTTAQDEILLDNHTGLFLIDYSFGMAKHEVLMPIIADDTTTKNPSLVEYAILDEDGVAVTGASKGIVLSHAPIAEKSMYKTEKGSTEKFTLAVFFTPEKIDTKKSYRLQVTSLPFNFDGTQQLQLNPSELEKYTTKLLSL